METEQFAKWRELVDAKASARKTLALDRTENNGKETEKSERLSESPTRPNRAALRAGWDFLLAGWVLCRTGYRALHRALWAQDGRCGFAGEFFKTAIKEIGEGKFGCSVADCDKKFRGADFVKANRTSDSIS